jgi:phosphate transport system substrate-binding protein
MKPSRTHPPFSLSPLLLVFIALCLTATSCSRIETPKPTAVPIKLRVAADDATYPLMQKLCEAYTALNENVTFNLVPGNVGTLSQMVYANQTDIAAISRLPDKGANKPDLWLGDLGIDGVAIIVNAQNPVSSLTMQDIRDIFSGVRGEWGDFDIQERGIIAALVREDGDGTRVAFDKSVMGDVGLSKSAIVLPSIETVINYTMLQPDAIGYVPSSRLSSLPAVLKPIGIEGITPDRESISNGSYRLVRTLHLAAAREPQGEVRKFAAWALGPDGQKIVAAMNYVPAAR